MSEINSAVNVLRKIKRDIVENIDGLISEIQKGYIDTTEVGLVYTISRKGKLSPQTEVVHASVGSNLLKVASVVQTVRECCNGVNSDDAIHIRDFIVEQIISSVSQSQEKGLH